MWCWRRNKFFVFLITIGCFSITVDYLIVGAGIIGLSIARELSNKHPHSKIAILEKEPKIGLHASGRNSGVLHSGIYYKEGSLKAKFCLEGSRAMAAYCDAFNLPIHRIGKVIVPQKEADTPVLTMLYQRAMNNGAKVRLITNDELQKLEPMARSATDLALFSPETSVVDSKAILTHIEQTLKEKNVQFYFNTLCTDINTNQKKITVNQQEIAYGHLFNTAGLYADNVAKACGLHDQYTMIPFKGLYYELAPTSPLQINHLIYPVPDMNVPFLGVHFTKSVEGKVYIGPTAIPALGREHYRGRQGVKIKETLHTFAALGHQYRLNKQGFRSYTHNEVPRFMKSCFVTSAQSLVPSLLKSDLVKSAKVGIRAQLLDKAKRELVMDFVVKQTANETHVLNAVSPAFTSAFCFSEYIVNTFDARCNEKAG